jgi:hypothetical protein
MKIAYFDTVGGIAGDMTLAAFVSAGLPLDDLTAELKKLPLEGFELTGRHLHRNAIDAVHIEVVVTRELHFHRDLHGIFSIFDQSTLSEAVRQTAKNIFTVIGKAEARIHNIPLEKVHFHEVGAIDSIIDIVGTAICLEKFAVDRVYSSPVRLGRGGLIHTQHGVIPTPSPATLEILKDYPVQLTDVPDELTTPTGAGIIKALSSGVLQSEILRVETTGYGAGTREIPQLPNFLRILIGEFSDGSERDEIVSIETNIDDMNPQVYPFLIEELLAAGAHDAYLIPIFMKKGRPGILLCVMADASRLDLISNLIYRHTTTIGLRIQQIGRRKLPRRALEVQTRFGKVRAKLVIRDGKEVVAPEFDECKRIATETGAPILEIMRQLEQDIDARNSSFSSPPPGVPS